MLRVQYRNHRRCIKYHTHCKCDVVVSYGSCIVSVTVHTTLELGAPPTPCPRPPAPAPPPRTYLHKAIVAQRLHLELHPAPLALRATPCDTPPPPGAIAAAQLARHRRGKEVGAGARGGGACG